MLRLVATLTLIYSITILFCETNAQFRNTGLPPVNRREEYALRNIKAKEVLKYMNLTADPCKDFYDFACGNWTQYHKPKHKYEVITPQDVLELSVIKELKLMLEEQTKTQDLQEAQDEHKVKEFYRSCLNAESSSDQQQAFLMHFVKRHGGLSSIAGTNWNVNYNWVQIIAQLRANYGLDILIGLNIDANLHKTHGNSIFFTEPQSTMIPVELCSGIAMEQVDKQDYIYESIQKDISRNMQSWFSLRPAEATRFAGDIVRFEFELCKQMRKEQTIQAQENNEIDIVAMQRGQPFRTGQARLHGNRQNAKYPRQTLQHWTQLFGNIIDFKQYVDIVFENSINDQVYMRSEAYFQHLARTVRNSSKATLANYIMYRALSVITFPIDLSRNKRPNYCIGHVLRYFPKFIGEMYNRKSHRSEYRSDVELVFAEIVKAFEVSLQTEWLDENGRRAARQKLAQFKISFPIYQNMDLSHLSLERLNYWHKLEMVMKYSAKQELNRLYNVDLNSQLDSIEATDVRMKLMPMESEIIVGWGLLQPPFYHYFYSNSLKYSLLGQHMARELVNAFDEHGWNSNPLSPMRWDEYTAEGFHNNSECFRTQFSNYLYNNPEQFRNASKLRELIADSSGVNIAFNAYLSWLDSMDSSHRMILSKETLPDVNFTNTQLFFINFAQTRCAAKYDETPPPEFLPMDRHTVERYSVNGPLANNLEFSREFGCVRGSEMNPDDKCVIY